MNQLDGRLGLAPQRVRGHQAVEIKRLFPRAQVIHGAPSLVSEPSARFSLAMCVFECGKIGFPRLALTDQEHGGCGTRPAQRHVADLFP